MHQIKAFILSVMFGLILCSAPVWAAEQKTTLMLGGQFCDSYLGEVETALKKVAGVKGVDLKSMKGHAIVTGETGTVKTAQLTAAVNALKGEGWHCKAEVMK